MMTQTVHCHRILIQARLPTLWGWGTVNVSGLSLRLSPTWAVRWSPLKREDRMTGQTLVLCLTHSVSDCQSLDMFEALLYHFMHFQISIQCLITLYSIPHCWMLIGSPPWMFLRCSNWRWPQLLSPVSVGLSWNGKERMSWIQGSDVGEFVFLPITTEMKS